MQRIEKFLSEPEVPDWATSLKRPAQSSASSQTEVGFENATFEWDVAPQETPSRFTLGPLDVRFPPDGLSVVSGPTGSGKSALLVALLGGMSRHARHGCKNAHVFRLPEMHCTSGGVILNKAGHQVAYCAQNPCETPRAGTHSRVTADTLLLAKGSSTRPSATTSSSAPRTGTTRRGTVRSSTRARSRRTLRSSLRGI